MARHQLPCEHPDRTGNRLRRLRKHWAVLLLGGLAATPLLATASDRAPALPGPENAAPGAPRWQAGLSDVQRHAPRGMLAWQVQWQVCIADAAQQAQEGWVLERRTLSGEGVSRHILSPAPACHAIEVARGLNPRSQGMAQREVLLAMQAGQLAYQFRWRHPQRGPGPWTVPVAVAQASSGQQAQTDSDEPAGHAAAHRHGH